MIGFPGFSEIAGGIMGLGSAYMGYKGQQEANEANIALGREQMDFQERMSNSAYQRATSDMKAAGLNPMLAYQQGGSSSPQGAMPQVGNKMASAGQLANVLADTMNKLVSNENIRADTTQKLSSAGEMDQRARNLKADFDRIINEALGSKWLPMRKQFEMEASSYEVKRLEYVIQNEYPQIRKMVAEAKLLGLEIPRAINLALAEQSEFKKHVSPFLDDAGKVSRSFWDVSRSRFGRR